MIEIGLVKREIPFGESEKNSKKSLYKVADQFCRFWFSVMATRRSVFDMAPAKVRMNVWRGCRDHVFAAAWEDIVRSRVVGNERLSDLAGTGGYWLSAGRWWQGGEPEWDVVSTNGDNTKTLLGEVKWSDKPFSDRELSSLAAKLKARALPNCCRGDAQYALFVPAAVSGICRVEDVEILTAENLLRGYGF